MEKTIIEFQIQDQDLKMLTPFQTFSTQKVNYIQAVFHNLEDRYWTGYDNVYAVWFDETSQEATEIVDGKAVIPASMLKRTGTLQMNLCANLVRDRVLKARMTSFPVPVLERTEARV